MKSFIKRARKIHRSEKGFTLIELLVVMAIIAILVGVVVPNLFGLTERAAVNQIINQHQQMRGPVLLYNQDTGRWPNEWSGAGITDTGNRQLWFPQPGVVGWDGPYIERPILELSRWEGPWGVQRGQRLNFRGFNNTVGGGGLLHTVLEYHNIPNAVARAVDWAIDDGDRFTGSVQWGGSTPHNCGAGGGGPDDTNVLMIIIARQ